MQPTALYDLLSRVLEDYNFEPSTMLNRYTQTSSTDHDDDDSQATTVVTQGKGLPMTVSRNL
jgi:hypothetical protein